MVVAGHTTGSWGNTIAGSYDFVAVMLGPTTPSPTLTPVQEHQHVAADDSGSSRMIGMLEMIAIGTGVMAIPLILTAMICVKKKVFRRRRSSGYSSSNESSAGLPPTHIDGTWVEDQ